MKGSRTLNNDDRTPRRVLKEARTAERNAAIVARYYWISSLMPVKITYEARIRQIAAEFYLSESYLIALLLENEPAIKRHLNQGTTIKQLENQFPHFNWKTS